MFIKCTEGEREMEIFVPCDTNGLFSLFISFSIIRTICEQHSGSALLPSFDMTTAPPSTRASSRKNRVYIFREFLLKTYGNYLSNDAVVLDVAGGKGDLSWLLQNVDGCQSVVVDPRPTQHQHILRSVEYLQQHPDEAAVRAIRHMPTHQPLATLLSQLPQNHFRAPLHFPIWMDDAFLEAVCAAKKGHQQEWELYWNTAITTSDNQTELSQTNTQQNNVTDPKQAWEIVKECKLIVAFHPDQATDFCFQLAALLDIPFCIVPCCVFPSQFSHRTLADGTRVRDYQGLLLYLTHKYSFVRKERLLFHETATARNIALFTLPFDDDTTSMWNSAYCRPTTPSK